MSFDMTIYLNLDSRFFEFSDGDMFRPTDRIQQAISIKDLPDSLLLEPEKTLETIFAECNMPEPTLSWAIAYRMAGHRSLSVGDVVALGERSWAVANQGFKPCTISRDQIVNDRPADLVFNLPDDERFDR